MACGKWTWAFLNSACRGGRLPVAASVWTVGGPTVESGAMETPNTPTQQDLEENRQFAGKVFDAAADSIDPSSVSIGLYHDNMLWPDRSGILLQIGSHHFLVTAAHANNGRTIADLLNTGHVPCIAMPGQGSAPLIFDSPQYMTTIDPEEDIAVFLLEQDAAARLQAAYSFLNLSDLMSRSDRECRYKGTLYVVVGYPKDTVVREPMAFCVRIWRFITHRNVDTSAVAGFNPNTHIILKYEDDVRNYEDGIRVTPVGLSGAGIWFVCDPITGPMVSARAFKLVGIQTAWHPIEHYLKGTWIDVVVHIIWKYYPDTRNAMRLHCISY